MSLASDLTKKILATHLLPSAKKETAQGFVTYITAGILCPQNQTSSSANLSQVSSPITGPLMTPTLISWQVRTLKAAVCSKYHLVHHILCMVVKSVALMALGRASHGHGVMIFQSATHQLKAKG